MNWLLIRGLAREKRHWGNFPNTIKENFSDAQVLSLEIPGVGKKYKEKSLLSIDENVYHLREEFIKNKKTSKDPWCILAISMGGMFAMRWAYLFPQDFNHIFIINSSSSGLSPLWERLTPHALKQFVKIALMNNNYQREERVFELTLSRSDIKEETATLWGKYADQSPVSIPNFLRQIYSASKFKIPSQIKTPITVLCGEEDKLASPICSEKLAKHFNCDIFKAQSCGHDIPLDRPNWLIEKLKISLTSANKPNEKNQ